MAALTALLIHSETVLPSDLAADVTRFRSSGLNRMGTMLPLALPFGNCGLPGRLGFFGCPKASELLYDCGTNRVSR